MTITLNKHTLIYVALAWIIIFLGWKVYKGGNNSKKLEVYQEQYEKSIKERDIKFVNDTTKLGIGYRYELRLRDSTLQVAEKESAKQILVINYYKKKINYVQVAPISIIDKSLDSMFRAKGY